MKKINKKIKTHKAFTIVETIVTIAIVVIVMGGFTFLFSRLWTVYGRTIETGIATQTAVYALNDTKKYVSRARVSENGSYPIVSATEDEFIFYSDYDGDGIVERVRYFLEAQQLKVGIIEPDITQEPASYGDDTETITTVSKYVINDVVLDSGGTCDEYQLASVIDGTPGKRFTSIGMARNVKYASQYYFNIGGNKFSTQVTSDGWVLIAAGNRSTNESSYNQVSDLYYDSDSILNSGIVNSFTNIEQVRVQATNESWLENKLPHDVVTSDSHTINDIIAFRTFGHEQSDNATWECKNAGDANCSTQIGRMKINAGPDSDKPNGCNSDDLDKHLYFACNNATGFIWTHSDGPTDWQSEEVERDNYDNDINLYLIGADESNTVYLTATKVTCGGKDFTGDDGLCYSEADLINAGAVCTDIEESETKVRPVFTYFDDFESLFSGTDTFDYARILNSKLSYPIDISKIELIKILLNINVDPRQDPESTQVQTFIDVRNLTAQDSISSP